MPQNTPHSDLKDKQRTLRDGFPETMSLRVHRAISWIGRAEQAGDDQDAAFLFLWIGFNSAYADEAALQGMASRERAMFGEFFNKMVALDREQRIYDAIWQRFSGPIRRLLENRYVFSPFWQFHNGVEGYDDWQDRFVAAARRFARALQDKDTAVVLSFVFDRLYVLRNQLIHGGATQGRNPIILHRQRERREISAVRDARDRVVPFPSGPRR